MNNKKFRDIPTKANCIVFGEKNTPIFGEAGEIFVVNIENISITPKPVFITGGGKLAASRYKNETIIII